MKVYMITNKITGKRYIGSTLRDFSRRVYEHKQCARLGKPLILYKSMRKHGDDAFDFNIIEECDTTEEMLEMEFHYIKQYNTLIPNGYNMTEGYDNTTTGYKFSKEQRKQKSDRIMGDKNPNYGNHWTDEQKRLGSEKRKGKCMGDENPSKRPEVKKILSDGKMGDKNPRAMSWVFTSPEGNVIAFTGGIKRKMKELGLSYTGSIRHRKGLVDNYKGWVIENVNITET